MLYYLLAGKSRKNWDQLTQLPLCPERISHEAYWGFGVCVCVCGGGEKEIKTSLRHGKVYQHKI